MLTLALGVPVFVHIPLRCGFFVCRACVRRSFVRGLFVCGLSVPGLFVYGLSVCGFAVFRLPVHRSVVWRSFVWRSSVWHCSVSSAVCERALLGDSAFVCALSCVRLTLPVGLSADRVRVTGGPIGAAPVRKRFFAVVASRSHWQSRRTTCPKHR